MAAKGAIEVISPADGSVYATRPLAAAADIDRVLSTAAAASREWRSVAVEQRIALVNAAVQRLVDDADALGEDLSWQMGRPIAYTPNELRRGFFDRATHMSAIAPDALADVDCGSTEGFRRFIRREPLGVVLVVAPWNYPYLASVNGVVPALLAGNAVVLKMASQTPLAAEHFRDAFAAAGLPEGVFQIVHADHAEVATMVADPRVGFVAFTGSVPGGHAIQQAAAGKFIATNLELGGKDPAYVRADCNLVATIAELVDGSFFNSGQSCCGIERIYVHRDVYDEFVDGFVTATNGYVLGHPLDPATTLGPMVRTTAADFVRGQIAEALAKGARGLIDPARFPADAADTPYLAPQVLVDVDHAMRVMTEESFGPVVGIMPVVSDDEAVTMMNDSVYGLTASIWSADVDAAVALGDRVDTGTIYLNRCDYLDPALAWTGVKDTGRGVSLSRFAYDTVTRPKSFHLRTAF